MNNKAILLVFAATLFISAFLIFSVQPMVSKMLLPMLGGSPSVWNTAMVFFQAMLLAGYAYAHFMARYFSIKVQAFAHFALLAVFTLFLPLAIPDDTLPPIEGGQAIWQIGVMLSCVGGPFFILAASAPLFQHWFSLSAHKDSHDPYFLYAVSNAGSMISLLSYPIIIEPLLGVHDQTVTWYAGYLLLIVLSALCASFVWKNKDTVNTSAPFELQKKITWDERYVWILLSFIPSSLMLGVTTTITTDLASAPFLWVIPLAIYLITFIIAFSKKSITSTYLARELAPYFLCFVVLGFLLSGFVTIKLPLVILHLFTFGICALLCHGELARLKPPANKLTEYFLIVSLGGVMGGIFNALVAPNVFIVPLEYPLTLSLIGFVVWASDSRNSLITKTFNSIDEKDRYSGLLIFDISTILLGLLMFYYVLKLEDGTMQVAGIISIFIFLILMIPNRFVFACSALLALCMFFNPIGEGKKSILAQDRSYFGVMRVVAKRDAHLFFHGTTLHGAQMSKGDTRLTPTTYYSHKSPADNIFKVMDGQKNQKIGALGLGIGSITCYHDQGRSFDFYEIDPDVAKIAENKDYFTYLSDCKSPYKIIIGDARLKIKDVPDNYYNMIFIDTFSSDNIPVHIITKDAFSLYLKKLSPDGFIAINISNRFLDLRPVLTSIAKELGLTVYFKSYEVGKGKNDTERLYTNSIFAVLAINPIKIAPFVEDYGWEPPAPDIKQIKPWTDDYADIIESFYALQ